MRQRTTLVGLLVLCCFGLAWAAPLGKKEKKEIQAQIGQLAADGDWRGMGPLLERLGEANDKATFKFIVKVVERSPEEAGLAASLRVAAEMMDDRRVQDEIKKSALNSKSAAVRRELIALVTAQGDWDTLIEALDDDDEEVAAKAAWKLIDERVERAVDPMITRMEKLDRSQGHIWDVYRNGLGKLLGTRCGSGVEYRSLWTLVQERGGLAEVRPTTGGDSPPAGSSVTLFGREIECTRVVFVLDISGSMEDIDPNQKDPLAGGTQSRGAGDSEAPQEPPGLTRLERAQIALKAVIERLPATYQINIVAYSSRVKTWRGIGENSGAGLHALSTTNRKEAQEFVDSFQPEGVTVTDRALEAAFGIQGARCIYLLSDGFATHDGQNPLDTSVILGAIDHAGKDRRVTIHTMGFAGADVAMMRAVAEHTGGRYSDIE